jgi:hypothetical protein
MKIIEVFLFQLANFIVFVGLRYMSAIAAIMAGIGSSNYYQEYGRFIYLPSSIIMLAILFSLLKSNRSILRLNAQLSIVIVLLLTVLSFFELIPGEIVTFDKISYFFK